MKANVVGAASKTAQHEGRGGKTDALEIELLLESLYRAYEYDFRGYARPSLTRRLALAREHFGCRSYSQLQDVLLHEPAALPKLLTI
jgi:chemotaxis protein methyltransferase CheR